MVTCLLLPRAVVAHKRGEEVHVVEEVVVVGIHHLGDRPLSRVLDAVAHSLCLLWLRISF